MTNHSLRTLSFDCSRLEQLDDIVKTCLEIFHDVSCFTLEGDLGAGKTTFTQVFCNTIDTTDEVSSPTFSIVNEYRTINDRIIYHFDLYRLENSEELQSLGFEEYCDDGDYILIEWPELAKPILDHYVNISIEILDENKRRYNFVEIQNVSYGVF